VFDALPNRAISVSCDQTVAAHHAITRQEARNSHYVLSAASQYEKWEYTLFTLEFPTNYFHLRAPLFEPLPGTLPEAEIYLRLQSYLRPGEPPECMKTICGPGHLWPAEVHRWCVK
jgi:anaerobic selenocysteine-containing dehydrogenase